MKDKREHIIETAIHLFAEKGYEGTSIREIAEKSFGKCCDGKLLLRN